MSEYYLNFLVIGLLVFLPVVIVRFIRENTGLLNNRLHRVFATIVLIVALYLVLYTFLTFI